MPTPISSSSSSIKKSTSGSNALPGSSGSLFGSRSSLIIIVFLAFLVLFWTLSTHIVFSFQASDSGISADVAKVQKLYDETRAMMKDLVGCSNASNMVKSLNTNAFYESEINILKKEKIDFEQKFSDCVVEKHKLTNELQVAGHSTALINQEEGVKSDGGNALKKTNSNDNSNSNNDKWLVVGIPTVSRPNNEDYLLSTLRSIANQLPSDKNNLLYHNILIAVIHVKPGEKHKRYEEAKEIFADNPYFLFEELNDNEVYPDMKKGATIENDVGTPNIPGFRVRMQTRNVAAVMKRVASKGKIYLFMEDDMEFCPYIFTSIQYLLHKADMYHPNWLAIRASYGMNGIFMHREDTDEFADYLIANQLRRPPDHLVVEWYAGETPRSKKYKNNRVNIGFKYNLFNHIGLVSSLRSEKQTSFPLCYDMLIEPTVFEVEAYNPRQCPHDDIWPCRTARPNPYLNKFKIPLNMMKS